MCPEANLVENQQIEKLFHPNECPDLYPTDFGRVKVQTLINVLDACCMFHQFTAALTTWKRTARSRDHSYIISSDCGWQKVTALIPVMLLRALIDLRMTDTWKWLVPVHLIHEMTASEWVFLSLWKINKEELHILYQILVNLKSFMVSE